MQDRGPVSYAVITFGCRVNQADSLAIERDLRARGATPAPPAHADLVIVNSCSVTANADQGVRQTIRRLARENPSVRVVVTGCYATREPSDVAALPRVARVITNGAKDDLAAQLGDDLLPAFAPRTGDGPCGAPLAPGAAGRTAFTLRVQTGCDEACSYCIIPTTRGAGRSSPPQQVMDDIRRAIAAGYKEIVLTGVHLGSYGRDLSRRTSLTALVHRLADVPEDVLFRISSLEPMDCTPELVRAAAASPRIAPHFHLPLQHGDDAMLRAMRRPYTAAQYRRTVEDVWSRMPHAAIGSDVIVGFPGETDAQFEAMCARLVQLPLSHLHVFPYSDRPDTDASRLPDKVAGTVVRERARAVRDIGQAMARRFRQAHAGTSRRALTVDDGWSAVTDNYLKVRLARQHSRNEWIEAYVAADL